MAKLIRDRSTPDKDEWWKAVQRSARMAPTLTYEREGRMEINIDALIGPAFGQAGAGFVLLGFTFGEGGFSTYLSNGCRSDVVRLLRETADRLEANEDMPPIRPGEPSA